MNLENKTYYHGSNRTFQSFDQNKSYGSKRRFVVGVHWFTDNLNVAKSYGKYIYEVELIFKNPYVVDANYENYSEIYLSYLPNEIGLQIDNLDNKHHGDTINYMNYNKINDPEYSLRFDTADLALSAMRAGYDSFIVKNIIDAGNKSALKIFANTYAVFDINQIVIKNVSIKVYA
jgi:hypothetical protein